MFLYLYNTVLSVAWGAILAYLVYLAATAGQPELFTSTSYPLTVIQLFAIIEVVNAAVGIVRSPLATTAMQVASRLLIVWGFFVPFAHSAFNTSTLAYLRLVVAWGVTEVVRYQFYAQNLRGKPGSALVWLRYNAFLVLYPLGVSSELLVIHGNIGDAVAKYGAWARPALYLIMATYAPGFYTLFGHMLRQRLKVMKAEKAKKQ